MKEFFFNQWVGQYLTMCIILQIPSQSYISQYKAPEQKKIELESELVLSKRYYQDYKDIIQVFERQFKSFSEVIEV